VGWRGDGNGWGGEGMVMGGWRGDGNGWGGEGMVMGGVGRGW
jgi:hypothetical protein